MQIVINYMAQLRARTGTSSEVIDLPEGSSARDLVAALADSHNRDVAALLVEDSGTPVSTLLFFVGEDRRGWEEVLHDGDRVTLMTPISGG